jgi:dienelactone hydrolase
VAAAALAAGSSYKAVVGRDLERALTVLQRWPGVDPDRLAVTGTSLGGELAVLLGALDSRVRVTVANSYGGATGAYADDERSNDDSNQTPHGCHTIPGINRVLLQEDWVRLIAPRAALVIRGDRNTPATTNAFERLVASAFRLYGTSDRFRLWVEPGGHEFYVGATAEFIERWL